MSHLRTVYIISFVLLVLATLFAVGYGRVYMEKWIITPSYTHIHEEMTKRMMRGVWYRYQKTLFYLPCATRCPVTDKLEEALEALFDGSQGISARFYTPEGEPFFPQDTPPNPLEDPLAAPFFEQAQAEQVASFLHTLSSTNSDSGSARTVVRTFLPILPDETITHKRFRFPAIIEIQSDITDVWPEPDVLQWAIIGTITAILGVLFGSMYVTTYKTEQLLGKQYEANLELIRAKTSAEEENRAKSKFLANISHELRTPLNAIIGFSEIIKDEVMGPLENDHYRDYVGDIYVSGVHLLSLINDILDYSKAEAGKLKLDIEEADVTKLLKSSLRLVSPRADEAGIQLLDKVPKDHYILQIDGKRLKQVVLNLLSNAVKFTPSGGSVRLSAWTEQERKIFVIEVQDTGVGIAPKDISKVMSTFGQVENKLSRKYEGTGLGLPLCKKLVELMEGQIQIQSELDKGTTITVFLPYTPPGVEVEEKPAEAEA